MPLLSFKIGSRGAGPEQYILRIPFTLSANRKIEPLTGVVKDNFKVEKQDGLYTLIVGPFLSHVEALNYFKIVNCSLLILSIDLKTGILINKHLKTTKYFSTPLMIKPDTPFESITKDVSWKQVDGTYEAEDALIIENHLKLICFQAGQATFTISGSDILFLGRLTEILQNPSLSEVLKSNKLNIALEIYSSSFFDSSNIARFLRFITVIESLIYRIKVPSYTAEIVNNLANGLMNLVTSNEEELIQIKKLRNRILELKRDSISKSIQAFINHVSINSPLLGDPNTLIKQITTSYDVRSNILHKGSANDTEFEVSHSFLSEFVPELLATLINNPDLLNY